MAATNASDPPWYPVTDKHGKPIILHEEDICRVETSSKQFRDAFDSLCNNHSLRHFNFKVLKDKKKLTKSEVTFVGLLVEHTLEDIQGRLYADLGEGVVHLVSDEATKISFKELFLRRWLPDNDPKPIQRILDLYTGTGDKLVNDPRLQIVMNRDNRCEVEKVRWNGVHIPKKSGSRLKAMARQAGRKRAAANVTEPVAAASAAAGGDDDQSSVIDLVLSDTETEDPNGGVGGDYEDDRKPRALSSDELARKAKLVKRNGTALSASANDGPFVSLPQMPEYIDFVVILTMETSTDTGSPYRYPVQRLVNSGAPSERRRFKTRWFEDAFVPEVLRPLLSRHPACFPAGQNVYSFRYEERNVFFYLSDLDGNTLRPGTLEALLTSPTVLGKEMITIYIYVDGVSKWLIQGHGRPVAPGMFAKAVAAPSSSPASASNPPLMDTYATSAGYSKNTDAEDVQVNGFEKLSPRGQSINAAAEVVGTVSANSNPSEPTTGASALHKFGRNETSVAGGAAVASLDEAKPPASNLGDAASSISPSMTEAPKPPPSTYASALIAPQVQEWVANGHGGAVAAASTTTTRNTDGSSPSRGKATHHRHGTVPEAASGVLGETAPSRQELMGRANAARMGRANAARPEAVSMSARNPELCFPPSKVGSMGAATLPASSSDSPTDGTSSMFPHGSARASKAVGDFLINFDDDDNSNCNGRIEC